MRLFGLIGYPLSHSFSKVYFSHKFKEEHIENCRYENFPIEDIQFLPGIISKNPELNGLNVTIPYKEKVIPFLDRISPEAEKIGAVNTIKIIRHQDKPALLGFNTDCFGFRESIRPMLESYHTNALVLGTGGASKAVKFALSELGIRSVSVSRNKSENTIAYEELTPEVIAQNLVIVNTTPLGTYPKTEGYPPLPYQHLTSRHLLYDLVYNPALTEFLLRGQQKHCRIKNGLEMLHLQAEKAWSIWNSNE